MRVDDTSIMHAVNLIATVAYFVFLLSFLVDVNEKVICTFIFFLIFELSYMYQIISNFKDGIEAAVQGLAKLLFTKIKKSYMQSGHIIQNYLNL